MSELSHITYGQQTRPCQVLNQSENKWVGAIFHLWAQESHCNQLAYPVAVVEYEDGSVQSVHAEEVRFTDSKEYQYPSNSKVSDENHR